MLNGLQKKWRVSGLQLFLILCTFAIGGSLTGYAGRQILVFFNVSRGVFWIISYIFLITLIWPFSVLLVSIFFGQYPFFKKYLRKIGVKLKIIKASSPIRIAVFASGAGSNAEKIIQYFSGNNTIQIALIICNKPGAGVLNVAERNGIPYLTIERSVFFSGSAYIEELRQSHIDFIVLAGFLWKIPDQLIAAYPGKIINIHPALLPKYGGKGMYGNYVHEAVLAAKDTESGITIHYVDGHYDHGDTIFQAKCPVYDTDTPQTLAKRIHELEHANYPNIIEKVITGAL